MRVRLPLFIGAALTLVSCNDSKAPTEPAERAAPSSSKALRPVIKVQPREANLDVGTLATSPMHDPKVVGSKLQCFSGTTDGGPFGGTCRRTPLANRDLAELFTLDGDPDGSYAGVWAVPVNIRGKRLGDVQELRFSYAGGPPTGGSPRWSVAIDENANGRHDHDPFDPNSEQYAFADVNACNDGDGFVGTEDAEDDGTCQWFYKAESFANWDAFAGAHPTYRIARLFADGSTGFVPAFVIIDQPGHYLVYQFSVQ